jgi:alpha-D-ribose 1-methylphosphonate 5-triphosphate synthase subunit PhnI
MSHSIPRNELEAIVLMADAALTLQKSLGDRVESVILLRQYDRHLLGLEHIAQVAHVRS